MGFPSNADLARSTGIDKDILSKLFNGQTRKLTVPNTLKIVNTCATRSDRFRSFIYYLPSTVKVVIKQILTLDSFGIIYFLEVPK
ncbi:MAG: hypothetical protein F6K54_10015 [Okeania sp. SIO3B5]|uniref:hypothetical protein n=1 Tax=Okeania sp. SIO3B5 TaxID=2607811 RepID=UPI0013FE558C|nr:hypothetical protein [Okeania sp. SIO3B5]NEO53388.1 hypothetical protein [Okeania sp. SIO3B5]